jgi:hypothetical protein
MGDASIRLHSLVSGGPNAKHAIFNGEFDILILEPGKICMDDPLICLFCQIHADLWCARVRESHLIPTSSSGKPKLRVGGSRISHIIP